MFMITFCDGGKPQCLASLEEAKMPISSWFKFNNSALMETEKDKFSEGFWDMGMSSMASFFLKISVSEPISLSQTKEVMEKRQTLMVNAV